MKLNEKLNLVVPVETNTGTIYVHSTPLSLEAFERYYKLIWKTHSQIIATENESMGTVGAVRIAAMVMKTVGSDGLDKSGQTDWDRPGGGAEFMTELRRLSNVLVPSPDGWQMMPLDDAVRTNVIDKLDQSEVENAIVFFIVSSAMHRRDMLAKVLDGMTVLWDAQTTSLNCTDWKDSLPKLTAAPATTGVKVEGSQVPS